MLLSTYLRMLNFEARAHTAICSEVCLKKLAVAAGLAHEDFANPCLDKRYGLAAVTTGFEMTPDAPLAPRTPQNRRHSHGLASELGMGTLKSGLQQESFAKREFHLGPHPFDRLKRRNQPITFIGP